MTNTKGTGWTRVHEDLLINIVRSSMSASADEVAMELYKAFNYEFVIDWIGCKVDYYRSVIRGKGIDR